MKEFEIWMEGFSATGQNETAQFLGKQEAEDFISACKIHCGVKLDCNVDGSLRYEKPSIWGCRLYDNEVDARKSFG